MAVAWWLWSRGGGEVGKGLYDAYGGDESVAAAGEGLDKAGVVGGVSEGFSDFVDGSAKGVVEVDDGILAPYAGLKFFSCNDLSGAFDQCGEDLEGLPLELDPEACLPKFAALEIDFIKSEAKSGARRRGLHFVMGFLMSEPVQAQRKQMMVTR